MKDDTVFRLRSIRRMGIGAVACVLEMWTNRQLELEREDFDELCARLIDLLGDARDEQWRLHAPRDTIPDSGDGNPVG